MKIYTIGYEGLDIDGFMSLLADNDIETVVDVREMPLSRKPGFSKKSLEATLNLSGREYVHMVALGCPKPIRDRYREDGNWKRYTEGFLKYLATQDEAVGELSALAATSNCALLCYEADYNFCHRSMVANAVKQQTHARVQHLQASDIKNQNCPGESVLVFA
ncbi:MAG: DUF488 domain-containing protein [Pseudomonadota bacterium]|nr:DUF488 domain-containing protein [Pseudomonadota bacterium]